MLRPAASARQPLTVLRTANTQVTDERRLTRVSTELWADPSREFARGCSGVARGCSGVVEVEAGGAVEGFYVLIVVVSACIFVLGPPSCRAG